MDVKDLKQAVELLAEATQNPSIQELISNELCNWDLVDPDNFLDAPNINQLFTELNQYIFKPDQDPVKTEALHLIVFDRIHDVCIGYLKKQFKEQDRRFSEKCRILCASDVSAQQFGADENYDIPLAAAIVELSVLDRYKTPNEKINCLCSTYDLVFAEIKTAMVTVIAHNSEKENDIPIIDNRDVIPVLMVVLIKSKLVNAYTNLAYIRNFFCLEKRQMYRCILESFEKAVDAIVRFNLTNLQPVSKKMLKNIDLADYIKITSSEDDLTTNRTLVDEANQRVLNLIQKATGDQ